MIGSGDSIPILLSVFHSIREKNCTSGSRPLPHMRTTNHPLIIFSHAHCVSSLPPPHTPLSRINSSICSYPEMYA